jgi:hypothetical protein
MRVTQRKTAGQRRWWSAATICFILLHDSGAAVREGGSCGWLEDKNQFGVGSFLPSLTDAIRLDIQEYW